MFPTLECVRSLPFLVVSPSLLYMQLWKKVVTRRSLQHSPPHWFCLVCQPYPSFEACYIYYLQIMHTSRNPVSFFWMPHWSFSCPSLCIHTFASANTATCGCKNNISLPGTNYFPVSFRPNGGHGLSPQARSWHALGDRRLTVFWLWLLLVSLSWSTFGIFSTSRKATPW